MTVVVMVVVVVVMVMMMMTTMRCDSGYASKGRQRKRGDEGWMDGWIDGGAHDKHRGGEKLTIVVSALFPIALGWAVEVSTQEKSRVAESALP